VAGRRRCGRTGTRDLDVVYVCVCVWWLHGRCLDAQPTVNSQRAAARLRVVVIANLAVAASMHHLHASVPRPPPTHRIPGCVNSLCESTSPQSASSKSDKPHAFQQRRQPVADTCTRRARLTQRNYVSFCQEQKLNSANVVSVSPICPSGITYCILLFPYNFMALNSV